MSDIRTQIDTGLLRVGNREYTVEVNFRFLKEAEELAGRSLKWLNEWLTVPFEQLYILLFAGIRKHHPDVTVESVKDLCDGLNPESLNNIHQGLCHLAWPEGMRKIEEDYTARLKKLEAGETLPNG